MFAPVFSLADKRMTFAFLGEVVSAFEPLVPRARSAIAYSLGREFAPNLRRLMVCFEKKNCM